MNRTDSVDSKATSNLPRVLRLSSRAMMYVGLLGIALHVALWELSIVRAGDSPLGGWGFLIASCGMILGLSAWVVPRFWHLLDAERDSSRRADVIQLDAVDRRAAINWLGVMSAAALAMMYLGLLSAVLHIAFRRLLYDHGVFFDLWDWGLIIAVVGMVIGLCTGAVAVVNHRTKIK